MDYHVEFAGADIFPQGFSAVADKLREFKGINMLCDIGNGTMNVMYINECRPIQKKCFTEKYGTHQCMLAVRENLIKQFGVAVDDAVIERVIRHARVHLAAGLPLTWVSEQKDSFRAYLIQNESVDFNFKGVDYHVDFAGADIFPQGFSAVADRLREFKGTNMLCDIGNGTMNVMYINECRPIQKKCFTEKYGTHQCMLAVRENLMKQFGVSVDETVLDRVIRHGTADISERYLTAIRDTAAEYAEGIFRRLREHEYDPELMRLYVVGGGSCILKNFGSYDKDRVTINDDICATAKGYELLSAQKRQKKGGIV